MLLENTKLFRDITNIKDGEPFKFAGYGFYSFSQMPMYRLTDNGYNKVPFAAAKETNDVFLSVAFYAKEVIKVDGDIYMYSTEDDPQEHAPIVGFDKRFLALPMRNKGDALFCYDRLQ